MTKKKRGFLKIFLRLAIGFAVLIVVWILVNFRSPVQDGKPLIVVSERTTGIVTPLDSNGDVDYFHALDAVISMGVTPENNAVVKLLEACGPDVESPLPDDFFRRLGMVRPPDQGDYYVEYHRWTEESGQGGPIGGADAPLSDAKQWEQYEFAMGNPWTDEQFPELARWRRDQEPAIAFIRAATQRPLWYCPLIPDQDGQPKILMARNSIPIEMREFARFLCIDAMWRLQRGEIDSSLDDALAVYRLARLVGEGPTLVDGLLSVGLYSIADGIVATVCRSRKPTYQQLKSFLEEMESLATPGGFSRRLKTGERFAALESVVTIGRESKYFNRTGLPDMNRLVEPGLADLGFLMSTVDWTEAILVVNSWSIRMIEASDCTDYRERQSRFKKINDELKTMEKEVALSGNYIRATFGGRRAKGRMMGKILTGMLMPAADVLDAAEFRAGTLLEMTKTMVALAAYEKEHGQYPEKLESLVPEFFASLPLDGFANAPFKYEVVDGEVKLYSVGENGVDEDGVQGPYGISQPKDDWILDGHAESWNEQ